MTPINPRYPIYIPSKGRADVLYTARFLERDQVPYKLVVEPSQYETYCQHHDPSKILQLPQNNQGLIYARNWIKEHATAAGYERHWQLDDNMSNVLRFYKGERIPCHSGVALAATEDFVDRYANVAIAGLNYYMFVVPHAQPPPFHLNTKVYSCTLVLNSIPHRWRSLYNDDTDICLQVLADGWCTILMNAFMVAKKRTMTVKGGNTRDLYQGDGRLKMSKSLERLWPGVVFTTRKFQRPQHHITDNWTRFDTPLKFKEGVSIETIKPNDYGLQLRKVKPSIKNPELEAIYKEVNNGTQDKTPKRS